MSNRVISSYPGELAGLLCAPIGMIIFFNALYQVMGFLPLPAPDLPMQEIADIYARNPMSIRIGTILMICCLSMLAAFYCTISAQLRRIEGASPVYSYIQLGCGIFALVALMAGMMAWATAALRPDRPSEIIQALNDFASLCFVMPAAPAVPQFFAIALAILSDRNPVPLYPRWHGYFTIWAAILFLPGLLCCMFLTGPFSWVGIIAFWVPAVVFGTWNNTMAFLMYRAVRRAKDTRKLQFS